MVIFHRFLYVYQRVNTKFSHLSEIWVPNSRGKGLHFLERQELAGKSLFIFFISIYLAGYSWIPIEHDFSLSWLIFRG